MQNVLMQWLCEPMDITTGHNFCSLEQVDNNDNKNKI